jgi:hypothetical protein
VISRSSPPGSEHAGAAIAPASLLTDWPGTTCLGRTCLKWGDDGELTSGDLLLVLERLAQVDQEVSGLSTDNLDGQPCPSIG